MRGIDGYLWIVHLTPEEFVRIGKALADPQRREILEDAAREGELSCSVILERYPLAQATVSHHLKELTTAGLLERRKDGQFAWFRFVPHVMAAYVDELQRRMGLLNTPLRRATRRGS
jgi:ArsR family transcriptional regulator, arsenate/arsenite/antimonite-responsive transcriptional repressor